MSECWLCAQLGRTDEHPTPTHQMILDWAEEWRGPAGWERKQALAQAKRDARELLKRKKPT